MRRPLPHVIFFLRWRKYVNKLILLSILLIITNSHCTTAHAAKSTINTKPRSLNTLLIAEIKKPIIVAVIDTGIDINHPNLKPSLWNNPGEQGVDESGNDKSTNGVDDDGNGYIDDLHGWNFTNHTSDLTDVIGHGTHISGIISGNSTPKILPLNTGTIKIMSLKYFDKSATDDQSIDNTIKAIHYAVEMGASVINYSSSGAVKSKKEEAAIKFASNRGVIFVTAAGNSGLDLDKHGYYPANYKVKNIISVSSVDAKFRRLGSSNYGKHTVPAPGKSIYSTLPGGNFGPMTGTSQATAFVTQSVANFIQTHESKNLTEETIQFVKSDFTKSTPRLLMN